MHNKHTSQKILISMKNGLNSEFFHCFSASSCSFFQPPVWVCLQDANPMLLSVKPSISTLLLGIITQRLGEDSQTHRHDLKTYIFEIFFTPLTLVR